MGFRWLCLVVLLGCHGAEYAQLEQEALWDGGIVVYPDSPEWPDASLPELELPVYEPIDLPIVIYPEGDWPGVELPSLPIPEIDSTHSCSYHELNGMIYECCTRVGPYGPYSNCTVFSNQFHQICEEYDIDCYSIVIACEGDPISHALNMTRMDDGQWCVVEPQGIIRQPCFLDPYNPDEAALCAAMGQISPCDCSVTTQSVQPLRINTNPSECTNYYRCDQWLDYHLQDDCRACCAGYIGYYVQGGHGTTDERYRWFNDCNSSCDNRCTNL